MAEWIGIGRRARRCYGFDEIALVPGKVTINPNEVDIRWHLDNLKIEVPIMASAMDGVVDTRFAARMGELGGIAVLNLEGIQTRYKNPDEVIQKIVSANNNEVTRLIQEVYKEPIKKELVTERIREIKSHKVITAVSSIPQRALEFGKIAEGAGADIFVVQSTVTTVTHISREYDVLDFNKFCSSMKIPVIVGNAVTYEVALALMETGIKGLLVGIGPGAACTTRGVLGIGVPQVTAIVDCASARDFFYKQTGRYIPIIADGGMSRGGDICKGIACGADSVMVGSAFARAKEAPGKGYHWGMATPHANLPRGTRIYVGTAGTLEQILYGPAELDDGSQNLVGAIKTSMGNIGARNIKDMQLTEIIIAPSIQTEGKIFQSTQRVGMGK